MTNKFRNRVNILLATVIALLGYGCRAKKAVVETKVIEEPIRDEIRVMYGVPQYTRDTIHQKPDKNEQPPIMLKYGVPPQFLDK